MHMGNMTKGMVPGIAIVAGGIPLAAGMALSFKMRKEPHVVACFFGDGAIAEGAFHEGVNMVAIWNLPVIFVCENNLYGASTHVDLVMKNSRISDRAASYGFRGETVDGNVAAVLAHLLYQRDNLIAPMLTGIKRVSRAYVHALGSAAPWRALVGLAVSCLLILILVLAIGL